MIGVPVTQNFQMVNIQRIETALVCFFPALTIIYPRMIVLWIGHFLL